MAFTAIGSGFCAGEGGEVLERCMQKWGVPGEWCKTPLAMEHGCLAGWGTAGAAGGLLILLAHYGTTNATGRPKEIENMLLRHGS